MCARVTSLVCLMREGGVWVWPCSTLTDARDSRTCLRLIQHDLSLAAFVCGSLQRCWARCAVYTYQQRGLLEREGGGSV